MPINSTQLAKSLYQSLAVNPDKESQIVDNFLKYCKSKGLQSLLPRVVWHLERMSTRESFGKSLDIIFHCKQSEEIVDTVKSYINTAEDTKVNITIDENIQGGFVAKYAGKIYDCSIRHQLQRAKQLMG